MSLPAHIRPAPGILASNLGTEIILLHTEKEHYYGLQGVGQRFWELLEKDASVDHAVTRLLETYDVEEAVLRRDLAVLWQTLSERGLVEAGEQAA